MGANSEQDRIKSCPCHSGKLYAQCCGPLHEGSATCQHVEALMRSRYSAYALGNVAYILSTSDPKILPPTPSLSWTQEVLDFARGTKFVGLKILSSRQSGGKGSVTFQALLQRLDGQDSSFQEEAHFTRHHGRWYYSGGKVSTVHCRPSSRYS